MKVLIVDDDATNRKLLRVNLQGEEIETIEAADGLEALAMLNGEKADAVISDILMPRMDGYRLCQEVRKNKRIAAIPFIFYTSTYISAGDEKLALDCGADRYIKKPSPVGVIMDAIHELIDVQNPRPRPVETPEELVIMHEYNAALVRKLEERNASLEMAQAEIMSVNEYLEERVEERTAELVLANQELEAFSHSIAHDLRSPLMAIDGFSFILLRECEGKVGPAAMKHLRYICDASSRMNELTSDLLRLSRANRAELQRQTVDMTMLSNAVIEDLRRGHPDRVVSTSIADGLLANADAALLRIALENLLGNAWKFTGKTANAAIEVGRTPGSHQYFIKDNGAGFDMASASRLFGNFERLHSEEDFPGTGIGLTTVQRIIRRHGGEISAEAEPGKGAVFHFDLGPMDIKEKS